MRVILSFICLVFTIILLATPATSAITNCHGFKSGNLMIVEYDLIQDTPACVIFTVSVLGKEYRSDQLSLEGDVGINVKQGTGKKIIWDFKKDFPGVTDVTLQIGSK
jgi:hypothetical protein